MAAQLEQKVQAVSNEYSDIRRNLNLAKQNSLSLLSNLLAHLTAPEASNVSAALDPIKHVCENLQAEFQRLVALTDGFEAVAAKSEGVSRKLLHCYRKSLSAAEGKIEVEVALPGSDHTDQINKDKLPRQREERKRSTSRTRPGAAEVRAGMQQTERNNNRLTKTQELLQEKEAEIAKLRHHLDEYVKISEEQYEQIGMLKGEASKTAASHEVIDSVRAYLKAVDYLGFVIMEDRTEETEKAKTEVDRKRAQLQKVVDAAAKGSPSGAGKAGARVHDQQEEQELRESIAKLRAVEADLLRSVQSLGKASHEGAMRERLRTTLALIAGVKADIGRLRTDVGTMAKECERSVLSVKAKVSGSTVSGRK